MIDRGASLLLGALLCFAIPADPVRAFGSDVEIICGIPPELFQELKEEFDAATQGLKERTQEQKELLALLREKLSLNERQVAAAFQAAGEIDVAPERYGEKLVEIAQRYAALKEELDARPGDNPEIAAKKQEAARALEDGDLDLADQLLDAVIALEDQALDQRALEAAATRAQKAEVALLRLRYREAAKSFTRAAQRVPAGHPEVKQDYLQRQAMALYKQGVEFGDNEALEEAIAFYRLALEERTRSRVPLNWAMTQNNLGNTLQSLEDRESGTRRLEEAQIAFSASAEGYALSYGDRYQAYFNEKISSLNILIAEKRAEAKK